MISSSTSTRRAAGRLFLSAVVVWMASSLAAAQEIVATPLHPTGIYKVGEKISWQIEPRGANAADLKEIGYVLKRGGMTVIKEGTLDLSSGSAELEITLDKPDTVLAELRAKGASRQARTLVGAVAAPDKIEKSMAAPDDFDAFWAAKIKELAEVLANPKLEPADGEKPSVDYFKLQMDNIRGSHIYGQLAKPKKEGKYPALLIVQWAGVYGLPKTNVTKRAEQGWIALNIMPHDLPFDETPAFYQKASQTTLQNYYTMGNDDREKSYFLRMYLSCYRAAQYLSERPDWDGKNLVVIGTSQGGQQSIVTAGMHPKISAMLAMVPGGCDITAPTLGRAAGFPDWAKSAQSRKNDKITETGRYFDAANFAPKIHGPALIATGLIDETCPPVGVLAACNQITSPKEVLIMVNSAHQERNKSQAPYNTRSEEWLAAIVKGEPVPPVKAIN